MLNGLLCSMNQVRLEKIRKYILRNYSNQIKLKSFSCLDVLIDAIDACKPDVLLLDLQDINMDLLNKCSSILAFQNNVWIAVTDEITLNQDAVYSKDLVDKNDHNDIYFFKWIHQYSVPSKNSKIEDIIITNANHSTNQSLKKMAVPTLEGFLFVNTDDIIRLEAKGVYTTIITTNGQKIISSKNLGEYEQLLLGFPFFRIHQSHLINLNKMLKYQKGRGGVIFMEDGSHLEVASRRKNEFIHLFEQKS